MNKLSFRLCLGIIVVLISSLPLPIFGFIFWENPLELCELGTIIRVYVMIFLITVLLGYLTDIS